MGVNCNSPEPAESRLWRKLLNKALYAPVAPAAGNSAVPAGPIQSLL